MVQLNGTIAIAIAMVQVLDTNKKVIQVIKAIMTRLKTKTYVISNKEKFKADVPPLTKASFKAAVIPHLESASGNSYINGT